MIVMDELHVHDSTCLRKVRWELNIRSHSDKIRILKSFLSIGEACQRVEDEHLTSRFLKEHVPGGGIPFHRPTEPEIEICRTFRYATKLYCRAAMNSSCNTQTE
jgi:hypothetical protein